MDPKEPLELPAAPAADEDAVPRGLPFPVVGVGGSAGGLEAFIELLQSLPPEPGMSFLFVLHLQPHFKSHLVEVLTPVTPMEVVQATEGMPVERNRVYLIPPNKSMTVRDGVLALQPRPPRGIHMPIDHLFRSLADVHKERAIGVILSGSGTDGTLGLQTLKGEGGVTFAQDERTAKHDSMPRSAVADGHVDYVLPPAEIARELMRLNRHLYTAGADGPVVVPEGEDAVKQIIALLRSATEVDFTHYKRTTINRRVHRRMALRGMEHLKDYLAYLRKNSEEVSQLYHDLLIRVTQFFRDAEAFEALKEKFFPALVKERPAGEPIRIWVAGCATGEEAYSIAITLLEVLGNHSDPAPVKILATDLNEAALNRARAGVYVDNIEIDVSPERLRRFFNRIDGHYQISKAVRDLCVFSRHNMASDPPFSHLHLVSCRNVLIYMDPSLQKRVLPILHYSLNPNGLLFLGSSENIGPFGEMFDTVDPKHRIFRKRPMAGGLPLDFRAYMGPEAQARRVGRDEGGPTWTALDVQREADRIVLARYAPVGVVIDEAMTVLQFRGRTAPYLEPAPGMASLDLMRMLREGLLAEVRGAINQARAQNTAVVREGLAVVDGDRRRAFNLEVIPFKVPPSGVRCFLVLFEDQAAAPAAAPPAAAPPPAPPPAAEQQVAQLQQELLALREYLQSVIEEQESTNEELKSANEEILSSNEELQSTNEELQTAKEEAQSANEELATVNEELRHRNTELARVNNDLVNLLSGVNIPIVIVSRELRIRRYTPLAEKLFNLIPTDMGRPISDIKSNLRVPDLAQEIASVIDNLTPSEAEVQDRDGNWYSLRIRPYVTLDNKIDGASVVLVDIDSIRRGLNPPQRRDPPSGPQGESAANP
jgi:two-component system CheB/CheR fusion protein